MMANLKRLRGKIVENGLTFSDCATTIKVSNTTFSAKMTGKRAFTVDEAASLARRLNLDTKEQTEIFLS